MHDTSQNYLERIAEMFLIGILMSMKASTLGPCLLLRGHSFSLA